MMIFKRPQRLIDVLVVGLIILMIVSLPACTVIDDLFGRSQEGVGQSPTPTVTHQSESPSDAAVSVLVGNPIRGKALFSNPHGDAPSCSSCHAVLVGGFRRGNTPAPNLSGIGKRAELRVPSLSAEVYLEQSIVNPGVYIVEGYLDNMYQGYTAVLTTQDIADLVAYLLTL